MTASQGWPDVVGRFVDQQSFRGGRPPRRNAPAAFPVRKIKRIDRVVEFQLDKKAMVEFPSVTSAAEELRSALRGVKTPRLGQAEPMR